MERNHKTITLDHDTTWSDMHHDMMLHGPQTSITLMAGVTIKESIYDTSAHDRARAELTVIALCDCGNYGQFSREYFWEPDNSVSHSAQIFLHFRPEYGKPLPFGMKEIRVSYENGEERWLDSNGQLWYQTFLFGYEPTTGEWKPVLEMLESGRWQPAMEIIRQDAAAFATFMSDLPIKEHQPFTGMLDQALSAEPA